MDFLLEPLEGMYPCQNLDLSSETPLGLLTSQTVR